MAGLLGTSNDNARQVFVALIALHDIGKFAEAFQCKVPDAWPTSVLGPIRNDAGPHHTQTAFDLREKLDFQTLFAPALDTSSWIFEFDALWAPVAGHHGRPVDSGGNTVTISGIRKAGISAALEFAQAAAKLFGPFELIGKPDRAKLAALSWSLAGLTNLADWIGSNREFFCYCAPTLDFETYWDYARKQAVKAISAAGISPVAATSDCSSLKLFPAITAPSPLQNQLSSMALPDGPLLAIVEDVTGSGKTEAALLLAARFIGADRAAGLFFALPTMATANAMFDRLGDGYRRMFAETAQPSLVLAHGRRGLHAGFQASILAHGTTAVSETDGEAQGDASSAVCATWIADDRRRAFLAHVGVGTIDQAFLGALPVKHQALRLWGLADRVLIVDEAHAYDAYMGRELERLLEFHAALGGSAIILSATLPAQQREALARAFAKGLGAKPKIEAVSNYPLVTTVSADSVTATPVETREDRYRNLAVRAVGSIDAALAHVSEMASRGAAVAWIRNSVDDAIEAAGALQAMALSPVLLHARFAMGDRLDIEKHVRETLGRNSDTTKRQGFVLVGTQILEQSLDYDVDAMITDLAPVDLIIQRAGRLWRHTDRKGRPVDAPELLVFAPDWQIVEDQNWYAQVSKRAAAVYGHHGLVWRSAKTLSETGCIETPGGVRALIESVYGPDTLDDVPEPLRRASNKATGREFAAFSIAGANLLKVDNGYDGNNVNWAPDTVTPTRLGDPVTVFRLGKVEGDHVVPWCTADDRNIRRSWALSEVSLSQRKAVGVLEPDATLAKLITLAKADWPEWEQDQPLLLVEKQNDTWCGQVIDRDKNNRSALYTPEIGLRIVAT